MLDAWYADRPEVQRWQREMIEEAHRTGSTRTLIGRYRQLEQINSGTPQVLIPSHPIPSHPIPSHPIPGARARRTRGVLIA